MQTAQRYVLKSYRVLIIDSDYCVVANLMTCSLNSLKILEYMTIKLDAISMGKISDGVMPKSRREYESILPVAPDELVVSVAADQSVAAISSEKEVITTFAIQGLPTIAPSNDSGRITPR